MEMGKNQVKEVMELVLCLEKAVKAVRMYPMDHPKSQSFLLQVYQDFTKVLSWASPLCLNIDQHDLLFDGEVVYSKTDNSESLAFRLYRDGIREIAFTSGLTEREVLELARALAQDFDIEHLDDDLATYLWEKDLDNVTISVIEDYLEDYLPEEIKTVENLEEFARERLNLRTLSPEEIKHNILTKPDSDTKIPTIPLKEPFLTIDNLRTLPQELKHLGSLLTREHKEAHFEDMLEIVFTILRQNPDEDDLGMFLSLFDKLLQMIFASGPIEHAILLIRRLKLITRKGGGIPPDLIESLKDYLNDLGSTELLEILGESLEQNRLSDLSALPDLLELLPSNAVPGLVALFGTVKSMKMRRILCQGLARIGSKDLEALTRELASPQWYVVRNIAYALGILGTGETIPHLGALIHHPDVRVRKEALRALGLIGGKTSADWIFRGLDHADSKTRRQALHSLPKTSNPALAKRIIDYLTGTPEFDSRPLSEREAFYQLLGTTGDNSILPYIKSLLGSKSLFSKRKQKDNRYLAAVSLAALNTSSARQILKKMRIRGESKTQSIIHNCLARPAIWDDAEDTL